MFTTGDSSGDGLSSLNQFAGMGGQIDWAAMAQQWIQMHDTGSFMSIPDAPPPPNISNTINAMKVENNSSTTYSTATTKKTFEEKGEADMDMDEGEENARGDESPPPPAPSMRIGNIKEQPIMQSQPWYMRSQNPMVVPPVTESVSAVGISNMALGTTALPQWGASVWPPQINLPPPTAGSVLNVPLNNTTQTSTAHIPSLLKMNVPNPNAGKLVTSNIEEQNSEASLVDAKKRKMLPAWIREGLEKMEREKQRQLEREQCKKHAEPGFIDSTSTLTGLSGITNVPAQTVNMKYNQYAENDRSGNEDDAETEDLDGVILVDDGPSIKPGNGTCEDDDSDNSRPQYETDNESKIESNTYTGNRSYEDRLSDLMIVVRRTLTELLLEVTNQEIASLAQETINSHKAKASSAQVIRKSALSSITGKLGLAAYDDSTGDESSDSDNDLYTDSDQNNDSEEEIKTSIRTKRRAFAKITNEIEERVAANAAREEEKLKYYTLLEKQEQEQQHQDDDVIVVDYGRYGDDDNPSTSTVSRPYERDIGETTETMLQHSNGKRQKDRNSRKERTTRFSDNKDSKGAAAIAANYISKIHTSNLSGNSSGNAIFPITATSTTTPSAGMTGTAANVSSASINTTSLESSHIAYNAATNSTIADDSTKCVSVLNKNLLNAAEAAIEKAVTKSHSMSGSRSSASRSERDRSYRSSQYDHRDHRRDRYHERKYEHERDRDRDRDRRRDERDRDRKIERNRERHSSQRHKLKGGHSSDEGDNDVVHDDKDDDEKREAQTSSSDTDSSSSSSESTSTNSHQSSHYSRTSTTSKQQRHDYEYSSRRASRDERHDRDRRRERSRSRSRSRSRHQSRRYHNQHSSSSYRHSSAEDDYDNESRYRHSSSRHGSSRKRSRSRSHSTYSSSSHRRRH